MSNSGWNMYVFRDGKRTVSGAELISSLTSALCRWQSAPEDAADDYALAPLIAAGELECALLDSADSEPACRGSISLAAEVVEGLATSFLTGQRHSLSSILQKIQRICVSASYEAAVQEGFAYYALHPRKVAMLLDTLALKPEMAVLGIRSIGATLSAVASSALTLRGVQCRRITVRPSGHPYDRKLELTPELRRWIEDSADAGFLIVDEGPGISGSSFLSVAEALVECGIDCERIQLIGSREVDPATLRAERAEERWTRFRYHVMQAAPLPPPEAGESLSGGTWRRHFSYNEAAMPASWAPLEPAKYLSADRQSIFKFEGYGHYGEAAGARAMLLDRHRFSPHYLGNRNGFAQYAMVPGRMLTLDDRTPELLDRMTDYLALRSTAFSCKTPQTPELEKMLRWDWQLEFGEELSEEESSLNTRRVTICDGRMMPHEWLRADSGEFLKIDAVTHGDNHFFPGPCDIAWDVAGAIVEWEMPPALQARFIRDYEARSGDVITQRLGPYLLAYTIFSLGWSVMAALAMQGEYDEGLLERDHQRYRRLALQLRQEQRGLKVSGASEESAIVQPSLRPA